MEYVNKTKILVESSVNKLLSNPYIMTVVKITLTLYAAQIAPKTPLYIENVFKNTYFKLFAISLMIYLSNKDLQLSILIAIIYVLGMNLLSGRGVLESFSNYDPNYKPYKEGTKLIESKNVIFPGCENITMQDLLATFEGDRTKFTNTVQYSMQQLMKSSKSKDAKDELMKIARYIGLPYNMSIDKPETAPYIATLLVNYGFEVNNSCRPPH
jgi:hypothetical protein